MKLVPYADLAYRRAKVIKHVFHTRERWWDVFSGLHAWTQDWNALRVAGVIHAADPPQAAHDIEEAHPVCDRNHGLWLAASESACDEALRAARVVEQADGRHAYIGDQGIYVVVARSHLVTSFRVGPPGSRVPDRERATLAMRRARRRGVRFAQGRASLMSRDSRSRIPGEPDA